MASIHGTYRKVEETPPALMLIGSTLAGLNVARSVWYLDSPVSNSGRLKALMLDLAAENRWSWDVQIALSPDAVLAAAQQVVASADSVVLDRCRRWTNLACHIVTTALPQAWVLDMRGSAASSHTA